MAQFSPRWRVQACLPRDQFFNHTLSLPAWLEQTSKSDGYGLTSRSAKWGAFMRACEQASPLVSAHDGLRVEPRVAYDPLGDQPVFVFKASSNGTTILASPNGVEMGQEELDVFASSSPLKPLQQWVCDTCGQLIQCPEDGWLEWRQDSKSKTYIGFRVCHHFQASPRRKGDRGPSCYAYDNVLSRMDNHLYEFLGPDGLVNLLAMISDGEVADPSGERPPRVSGFHDWVRIVLRLHIPHYEEARRHFKRAQSDDFLEDLSSTFEWTQEKLLRVIAQYEG